MHNMCEVLMESGNLATRVQRVSRILIASIAAGRAV